MSSPEQPRVEGNPVSGDFWDHFIPQDNVSLYGDYYGDYYPSKIDQEAFSPYRDHSGFRKVLRVPYEWGEKDTRQLRLYALGLASFPIPKPETEE